MGWIDRLSGKTVGLDTALLIYFIQQTFPTPMRKHYRGEPSHPEEISERVERTVYRALETVRVRLHAIEAAE